ncbi:MULTISPECIES: response regulator transcription factor [unclassified Mesorhizobium]|uniref:response regulator transcription factor n=1 Tax=unclassified Mesorhizobium TaxID=325217 RepID=UPI0013E2EBB6|nr:MULTISPECIES: response regulator transcription factor [unclassified Mesorhizobium]
MTSTIGLHSNTSANRSVAISRETGALHEKEERGYLLILDERALDRECLASALLDHEIGMAIVAMRSIEEWRFKKRSASPLVAILFNLGDQKVTDNRVADKIKRISSEFKSVPVVILADTEDLAQILAALECGARGYIPTSVGIDVCVEAVNLAAAGGIFVPASSVLSIRHLINPGSRDAQPLTDMFTLRQAEVAEALRRGKANKIIAYELNLRESTVKVHIRNIMRKLKATNRTEVAYKVNDLFAEGNLAEERNQQEEGSP